MSIASYISDARELLSSFLQESETQSTVDQSPYSSESIRYRKWYWNCSKASRALAELAEVDLPKTTEADMDQIIQTQDVNGKNYLPVIPFGVGVRSPPPTLQATTSSYKREPATIAVRQSTSNSTLATTNAQSSAVVLEKLNMDGFEAIQRYLDKYKLHEGGRRSNRPYISLGDLGMSEGWTTIITNAAYCYDNNPAEGWRKEVAIRMSGKSRGSTDIHYVTPDKSRRFRSRQELQSYLNRMSTSSDFINRFDFRAAFCTCHGNEDHTRSYLECSYGLAGCNRWVHPECVGLGVRSEQELALMPKVICPLCAAYLESTGKLDSVRTPDMLILRDICWEVGAGREEDEDEIEASAEPHVLWGLQGSPFVYCSASGMSGLDALAAGAASTAADRSSVSSASLSTKQRSPSASSLQSSHLHQQSQQSAFTAVSSVQAPELGSILQHRLFQGWTSGADSHSSHSSDGAGHGDRGGHHAASHAHELLPPAAMVVEPEEVVLSDEDEGVPSNPLGLEPGDRVRRARQEDGSTLQVRVEGGWMVRKKPRVEGVTSAPVKEEAVGVAEVVEGVTEGADIAAAASGSGEAMDVDVQAAAEDAESMKRRILEKAAARKAAGGDTSINLAVRHKHEVIEAAVNAAQSSSHKKKTSFSAGTITAVAAGHASAGMIEQTLRDLRDAYQAKPSLCFLPAEDGGVRFASVSFAQVPRSLHPLCATSVVCGVCLHYNDASSGSTSAAAGSAALPAADKALAKKASKKRSLDGQTPHADRFQLVQVSCGVVSYSVHRQCVQAAIGNFLTREEQQPRKGGGSSSNCSSNVTKVIAAVEVADTERGDAEAKTGLEVDIKAAAAAEAEAEVMGVETGMGAAEVQLASMYEYEQVDDAECDLCGRKGGVLRYFNIAQRCSSVPAPAAEGWLGHIPCIQYLQASKLLCLLVSAEGSSTELTRFAQNPLSCEVAAGASSATHAGIPSPDASSAKQEHSAESPAAPSGDNQEQEDSEGEEQEGGKTEGLQEALLQSNRLHAQAPLSRFDQQLGHWRCTLCGLQCGLAPRCMAAGCTVRAHPLCVTTVNHPLWRVCSLTTTPTPTTTTTPAGVTRGTNGRVGEESVSMGILCPLHSVGLNS